MVRNLLAPQLQILWGALCPQMEDEEHLENWEVQFFRQTCGEDDCSVFIGCDSRSSILEVAMGGWLGRLGNLSEVGRVSEEESVSSSLCTARGDLIEGVLGWWGLPIEPSAEGHADFSREKTAKP